MGGDDAPEMIVEGTAIAHERAPHAKFILFGDENRLKPLIAARGGLASACTVEHTTESVADEDKPSQALRKGRQSSMRLAIDAVKDGRANGVVSAGNTGALMAMSKVVLKTISGIDRPALSTFIPTIRSECVMLDLGANIECDEDNLVQFAVMGADFFRTVKGVQKPTVGLLNVGVEDLKGNETVKNAAQIMREAAMPFEFYGFVEGDDITKGTVDVVVTDGFTGNVALKTAEGAVRMFSRALETSYRSSWLAKLGYLLSRHALHAMRESLDPRTHNGALLLGLNGIAVKSHGSTDGPGFANAVTLAVNMVDHNLIARIVDDFVQYKYDSSPQQKAAIS
jgi:glycerol-3-phosphate acyltransferase PlsX